MKSLNLILISRQDVYLILGIPSGLVIYACTHFYLRDGWTMLAGHLFILPSGPVDYARTNY